MADDGLDDLEDDEPHDEFGIATAFVRSSPGSFTESDLLYLYGRYKQALDGPCNVSKPGIFNLAGRTKWEAWRGLGKMSSDIAKKEYIEKVTLVKPNWLPSEGAIIKNAGGGMAVRVSKMAAPEESEGAKPSTPCEYIKNNDIEALKCFISNNSAAVNQADDTDDEKLVPLHWACDRGNEEIVSYLLTIPGIDVNIRDTNGQTPLHYAASCDHLSCVKLLIKCPDIDPTITDNEGYSALELSSDEDVKYSIRSFSAVNS